MQKQLFLLGAMLLLRLSSNAQDSAKVLNHEIGFNSISLLSQVRLFTVTPGQQPYDIFYNIYYKDLIGIRLGLGALTEKTETQIEGQRTPRSTRSEKLNTRAGVSYNVVQHGRVTCNLFVDALWLRYTTQTSNTSTVQVFPNPVLHRTVTNLDEVTGGGVQVGAGVKVRLVKHLSLYTEIPISYLQESHIIEDVITESGSPVVKSKSLTETSGIKIALPVTIYLVLRF